MPISETNRPFRNRITDERLARAAEELWHESRDRHKAVEDRQCADGAPSDNGRRHCLQVENYLELLAARPGVTPPLNTCEAFLLSAAACCHDFGKALSHDDLRQRGYDHGDESARQLRESAVLGRCDRRILEVLAELIGAHSKGADALQAIFTRWGEDPIVGPWPVRQRQVELLLRYADALDTTYDRIMSPRAGGRIGDDISPVIQTRDSTWGVSVDGGTLLLTVRVQPRLLERVRASLAGIIEHEFDPLRPFCPPGFLPSRVHPDIRELDYAEPAPVETAGAPAGEPAAEHQPALGAPAGAAPWLRTAAASIHAAARGQGGALPAAEISAAFDRSTPAIYWFVSSVSAAELLDDLGAALRRVAVAQDVLLLGGLYRALMRTAEGAATPVLACGLLDCLWDGPTGQHRWYALRIIAQTGAWRSPLGVRVLEAVAEQDPRLVDFTAMSLADYVRRQPDEADYALGHIVRLRTTARAAGAAASRDFTWDTDVSDIAEVAPAAVLKHATQLAELDLQSDPNEYRVALELRDDDGTGYTSTLVRLRNLLSREAAEPTAEGNDATARRAIARLLRHSESSLRTIGISAISRSFEHCHDLAVQALLSPSTWQLDAHDVAEFILREVFPRCPDADRARLEETVLSIPLDERPELAGWRRHYALTAIPREFRSQRVQDEIDQLAATYPRLATQEGGELIPGPIVEAVDPAQGLPALDDAVANPAILPDAVARLIEHEGGPGPHAMYSVHIAVRTALTRHPELLLSFVEQLGRMERPLYDLVGPGVVDYLNTATDEVTGDALLNLALVLPGDPGPRFVDSLAYLFEKRWDSLAEERREELAALLMRWADEGAGAGEEGTQAEQTFDTPNSLIEAGLRAPRGALVHAMIFVGFHLGAPAEILAAIRRLVEAGPLPIRAVALYALAPLLQRYYAEVLPIAVIALSEPSAALLPVAGKALRVLQMPEVETVGFALVRRFLDAEHDEVQRVIGLLTALWSVRDDAPARGALLHEVLRDAGPVAREMVGNVMATNTVGEDQAVMERARQWCADLLPAADTQTRVGMLQGWMRREGADLAPALELIGQAAASADKEAVEAVADWLSSSRREISDNVTQTLVSAVLGTPLAVGVLFGHYSLQAGGGLQALHQRLLDCGRDDLALRLLDAAAYNCAESARTLISQHQPEEPPQP